MAVFLEVIDAGGNVTRLPIQNGRIDVAAQPGTIYRLVDENGAAIGDGPRVLRIADDLVIDDLPGGDVVGLTEFFSACTPESPCTLSLAELGGGSGATITPASEPVAALQEGGFLMNRGVESPEILPVEPASDINWKPIAAGVGGLVVIGAIAGGGGGGGGDSDPPAGPVLSSSNVNSAKPLLEGTAEPNSRVTLSIDIGGSGEQVRYTTTADTSGRWQINLATDEPLAGSLPEAGLPTNASSPISLVAVDSAGNISEGVSGALVVDTTPPAAVATLTSIEDNVNPVAGAIADGGATNDTQPTLTGTLSAPLEAGDSVFVLRDGVIIGQATVSGTGFSYTDGPLPEGTASYSVQVRDAAGNATVATAPVSIVVDVTPPGTALITSPSAGSTVTAAAAQAGITVTGVVEAGTGATNVNVSIGNSTQNVAVAANNQWSAVFQSAQLPADGSRNITAQTVDAAGNVGPSSPAVPVTIDRSPPTLALASNGGTVTDEAFSVSFTFSEPVTGFSANDISVTGAAITSAGVSGSGASYSATFVPTANQQGNAVVSVPVGAAADGAGNPSAAASVTQAVDRLAPILAITDDTTGTATGPVVFTFDFGERVSGFNLGDIVVQNGTPGTLETVSAANGTYTLSVAPGPAASGSVFVTVPAGAATDTAGNGSTGAAASQTYVLDTTRPTLTISENAPSTGATGPVTFTFTFSEPVTGFVAGDVAVTGGTPGTLTGSGSVYTMVVTPTADDSGDLTVAVAANRADDLAGNGNVADSVTIDFDTTIAPTLTITENAPPVANSEYFYTLTFSEPVTGLANNDISVTDADAAITTAVAAVGASETTYTVGVTPANNSEGAIEMSVRANAVRDADNQPNAFTGGPSVNYDRIDPDVTITDNVAGTVAAGPVTFTFQFDEPVTTFAAADVAVTSNGDDPTSTFTRIDADTYRVVVTPAADDTGTLRVTVAAGSVEDAAGNTNAQATRTQNYDTGSTSASAPVTLNITTQDLFDDTPALPSNVSDSVNPFMLAANSNPAAYASALLPAQQPDPLI